MLAKRSQKVRLPNEQKQLVFQPLSWHGEDVDFRDIDGETDMKKSFIKYVIKCFGVDEHGRSVSITINDFMPFFYIKLDDRWTQKDMYNLKQHLQTLLPYKMRDSLVSVKLIERKDFWGFTNFKAFKFAKLTFKNHKSMKNINYALQSDMQTIGSKSYRFKVYESNIEPFIRFIHLRNIEPTSWINVSNFKKSTDILPSICQIDAETSWQNVTKHESLGSAPFVIASFDIETKSNNSIDFPVAKQNYKKLANEIFDVYAKTMKKELSDSNKKTILSNCLCYAFRIPYEGKNFAINPHVSKFEYALHINRVYTKQEMSDNDRAALKFKIYNVIDCIYDILEEKNAEYLKTLEEDANAEKQKHLVKCHLLQKLFDTDFPEVKGDMVIQIGTTFHKYGERECCFKHILTLGSCEEIENTYVKSCESEKELLTEWTKMIQEYDPDIITGFNIFGYDFFYMYERAQELGITGQFMNFNRLQDRASEFKEQKICSAALGENMLKYIDMPGRVLIDIFKVVHRDHNLDSYKLDNVAEHFLGLRKNDVSPRQIFQLQDGSAADRKKIAEYCIQDCELCNKLMIRLEIIANNMGMSNVCLVPLSYIFMRGQGIKIYSLVLKQCDENGYLIPVIRKSQQNVEIFEDDEEDGYEGAIVLEPKTGIYIDDPVSVVDYASLYPSSMISGNLSHDCFVMDPSYDNLEGVEYKDITYDKYNTIANKKSKIGVSTSRFVQLPNGEKGIIPRILMKLLDARKSTRKKITMKRLVMKNGDIYEGFYDANQKKITLGNKTKDVIEVDGDQISEISDVYSDFQKIVLDGLQLAYKVTANSLYGQIGAKTSHIYLKDIAACTTAIGRQMIMLAKDFLETRYSAQIIYGDTDSVFAIFPNKDENGKKLVGQAAIKKSIESAQKASADIKAILPKPHDLEYEKTFWPFVLLSKKKYVGNKYEFDDVKFKMNSMGTVLKRRDNAPIVKHIYGGIIDIILNEKNIQKSISYVQGELANMVAGKYPLNKYVITKKLHSDYVNPLQQAHKVLADRIAERDPGNKPQINDRLPYVFVQMPNLSKNALQGEKVEHPDFIVANKLSVDYTHYITNQVMAPILQLYGIVAEQVVADKSADTYERKYMALLEEKNNDVKKAKDKLIQIKETDVKAVIFDPILNDLERKKQKNHAITDFFKKK